MKYLLLIALILISGCANISLDEIKELRLLCLETIEIKYLQGYTHGLIEGQNFNDEELIERLEGIEEVVLLLK